VKTLRERGIWETVRIFTPVTFAYSLSFYLYGFWFKVAEGYGQNPENMSAFPVTLLIGILLLVESLRKRENSLALFSTPLIVPYVSQFSYSASLLALFNRPALFIIAWVLLWIPVLARFL